MFPRVSYHIFSKNALTFIRSLASESVSLIYLSKNLCVINNNCLVSSCIWFHLARTTESRLGLPPSFYHYWPWDRIGWGSLIHKFGVVWVGEQEWVLSHTLFFFYLCFCHLFFHVLCLFFEWLDHDSCCVCFRVYYLFSLSPFPLTRSYWDIEIVVMWNYLWSQYLIIALCIFLEKWVFLFESPFRVSCPTLYIIIRLLGRVYHFSLLICYPCSFYFPALMLIALWECQLPPLNGTGKD